MGLRFVSGTGTWSVRTPWVHTAVRAGRASPGMHTMEAVSVCDVTFIAKSYVKFLLLETTGLTNRLHCNSQRETLMNWWSIMKTPVD